MTRFIATFGYVGFLPGPARHLGLAGGAAAGYLLHLLGGFPLLAAATLARAMRSATGPPGSRPSSSDDLDPSHIVIDEVVGQWIALMPLSARLWLAGAPPQVFPWPGWVGGFLLFRLFDIWKPGPGRLGRPAQGTDRASCSTTSSPGVAGARRDAPRRRRARVAAVIAEAKARALIDAARARGWKIATAESCTGGLVSAAITDIAGSSDVFDRGFVTYSYPAKVAMLGVPQLLLTDHGAVSEPVARAMAEGALAASDADVAVAVTGVAGPGASEAKPEGLVWFATATADGHPRRAAGVRRARPGAGAGAERRDRARSRASGAAADAVERRGALLEGADDPEHRLVEHEADQLLQDGGAELEVDEEVDLARAAPGGMKRQWFCR